MYLRPCIINRIPLRHGVHPPPAAHRRPRRPCPQPLVDFTQIVSMSPLSGDFKLSRACKFWKWNSNSESQSPAQIFQMKWKQSSHGQGLSCPLFTWFSSLMSEWLLFCWTCNVKHNANVVGWMRKAMEHRQSILKTPSKFYREIRVPPGSATSAVIGRNGKTIQKFRKSPGISFVRLSSGKVEICGKSEEVVHGIALSIEALIICYL